MDGDEAGFVGSRHDVDDKTADLTPGECFEMLTIMDKNLVSKIVVVVPNFYVVNELRSW